MNKKISTGFAIAVIIIIAGVFAFIVSKSDEKFNSNASDLTVNKTAEESSCPKKAYDGEATVKGWYVNEGKGWMLQISNEDLEKLPAGHQNSQVILADGSDALIAKLEKASEKNPEKITIKGFYSTCKGVPIVSIAPGEEVFKKYLTQK